MTSIVGYVDRVERNGTIEGWAFDPNHLGEPVRLTLRLDGRNAAECVCDRLRPDVEAAMPESRGIVGFSCTVSRDFLDGVERTISFSHAASDDEIRLEGPSTFCLKGGLAGQVALNEASKSLTGSIEVYRKAQRLTLLEIAIDGRPHKVITLASKGGETRIPFTITLPATIFEDNAVHDLSVRFLDTGEPLSGSPLQSKTSRLAGSFDNMTGRTIRGWAADLGFKRSVSLDLFCDDTLVKQIACVLPRPDVEKAVGFGSVGFEEQIPLDVIQSGAAKIHLRFSDGSAVPGSPKPLSQLDLELVELENLLFGGVEEDDTGDHPTFIPETSLIGKILATPSSDENLKFYRVRTIELAYELMTRITFALSSEQATEAVTKLALLSIHSCRSGEDLQVILPILQRLPVYSPLALGLVELERQRKRPFNKYMLAGLLFAYGRDREATEMLFETFWAAPKGQRDGVAKLSAEILLRGGCGQAAVDIVMAELIR